MKAKSNVLSWLSVLALCVCQYGNAQEGEGTKPESSVSDAAQPEKAPLLDLFFEGGSLIEFFQHVNEQSPHRVNVVLPPECEQIVIQPMEISNVTFDEVIRTLSVIGHTNWELMQTGENLWTFIGEAPKEKPVAMDPSLHAYPMSAFLDVYEAEDLITLFTTMWDYTDVPAPEAMTYHEETRMLLIKASPEQNEAVERLMVSLESGHDWDSRMRDARDSAKANYTANMEAMESAMRALQEERQLIEERMKEELRQHRDDLREAQARIQDLTLELAKIQQSN